jgi:hypothetical protein
LFFCIDQKIDEQNAEAPFPDNCRFKCAEWCIHNGARCFEYQSSKQLKIDILVIFKLRGHQPWVPR